MRAHGRVGQAHARGGVSARAGVRVAAGRGRGGNSFSPTPFPSRPARSGFGFLEFQKFSWKKVRAAFKIRCQSVQRGFLEEFSCPAKRDWRAGKFEFSFRSAKIGQGFCQSQPMRLWKRVGFQLQKQLTKLSFVIQIFHRRVAARQSKFFLIPRLYEILSLRT
ncbi:hypothetical protein A3J43_01740 [Candidatus Uhrbacteria bacterium RIFCSPHIGHO2_12_FULL_54_23]|uniref:Uncharacterized protein n=1 Tax=Candidatus Uhrbacteria bacterium RIFCSPHIGHO2_12_FULL_54_23 TaxID=1802397 RepID=A0A1F7UIN1_9BACT|nr:MAG: hypothetical protein A3J43_01740 [Candidatus Uhrbacteria bacterium RIFCSPHIGHO2_12_FULL_54_23]